MKAIGIDSIVLKFSAKDLSLKNFLFWLQFENDIRLNYVSEYQNKSIKIYTMFFEGTVTKLKVQYHKPTAIVKLEVYGIFQYNGKELLNTLGLVLKFIEGFYSKFEHTLTPSIARVDISYDIPKSLSKIRSKIIRWADKNGFTEPKRFFEGHSLKGFSFNSKPSRFRLVVYDKQLKNKLPTPITRVELCLKEKYKKPIPLESFFCFHSYLKLLLNEFGELIECI